MVSTIVCACRSAVRRGVGGAADERGQRRAVQPLRHQHLRRRGDHARHVQVLPAAVLGPEGALPVGLGAVVELLQRARPQLPHHRPRVETGHDQREQPGEPLENAQVRLQGLVRARVLDLDGDLPPLRRARPVHLADAGCRGRQVVELGQPRAPLPAELLVEHPVHVARGQRRALGLQPDQRPPVRLGQLGGHHRLVDGQRLADLHRAPAQLAEHGEQLFRVALHGGSGHGVGVCAGEPTAPSRDRTAGERQRQGGDPGRPRGGAARKPFPATVAGPVATMCVHVRAHHRLRPLPTVPGRSRCYAHARGFAGPARGPLRRRVRVPPGQLRRKASTASTRRLSSGPAVSPSLVNTDRT